MSKRENSKYKIDRRLRVNLWGRPKSPINKREYGPGQHGQGRQKPTDYRLQLMAKQRLKGYYGSVSERQLRRYYLEAVRRRGDTGENLVELLERRLDAVIYRMKFAITVFASRQLVSHGHVKVNGKRVNIASYLVKDNDVIELTSKAKEMVRVIEVDPDRRARRAGIRDGRPQGDEGHLRARAEARRRALPGADGAVAGGRVLQPLTGRFPRDFAENPPFVAGFLHRKTAKISGCCCAGTALHAYNQPGVGVFGSSRCVWSVGRSSLSWRRGLRRGLLVSATRSRRSSA